MAEVYERAGQKGRSQPFFVALKEARGPLVVFAYEYFAAHAQWVGARDRNF
jgi:hypothetical protein